MPRSRPLAQLSKHGPHLGTGMDSALAEKLCAGVGARTNVPVLPLLPYGCSPGHSHRWPGTLALSPQTLIALVSEIGDWLRASGSWRFLSSTPVTNVTPPAARSKSCAAVTTISAVAGHYRHTRPRGAHAFFSGCRR